MASNPLMLSAKPVSRDLDQFIYEANQNLFVQDSGRLYFANSRIGPKGETVRFMDRNG